MITPQKKEKLHTEMKRLNINETDIEEKFIKGSGKGGQKVNKTNSTVQLHYKKENIVIKCGKTRSREDNRFFARRELCEAIDAKINGNLSKKEIELEKIRKQKSRRKRRNQSTNNDNV